ncbi:DUF4054 domain-containing protein [Leptolyngbya sp. FACHB-541]|nr:DUF4054 domain-containing protein [Leptolyngbya sp. FACHB-541]
MGTDSVFEPIPSVEPPVYPAPAVEPPIVQPSAPSDRIVVVTVADLLAVYPKFTKAGEPFISAMLARAHAQCPLNVWGDSQFEGVMLYTAHLIELEWQQMAETAGMAVSIAAGQKTAASARTGNHLNWTSYGQQFDALSRTLIVTRVGFVV